MCVPYMGHERARRTMESAGALGTHLDLEWIRNYRIANPKARRKRIAMALCEHWEWRNGRGHLKKMAARSLLNKLADQGLVELPPVRQWVRRNAPKGRSAAEVPRAGEPIEGALANLQPLSVLVMQEGDRTHQRWAGYLRGLSIVEENMGYRVVDRKGRDVAALFFGAAAWRCSARDRHLGWTDKDRSEGLAGIANNTRFLIMPWVRVPHLASHVLGIIQRRISEDWQMKYSHDLQWLETFVDTKRFAGTYYRAANWQVVGRTRGQTRQDREHRSGTILVKFTTSPQAFDPP